MCQYDWVTSWLGIPSTITVVSDICNKSVDSKELFTRNWGCQISERPSNSFIKIKPAYIELCFCNIIFKRILVKLHVYRFVTETLFWVTESIVDFEKNYRNVLISISNKAKNFEGVMAVLSLSTHMFCFTIPPILKLQEKNSGKCAKGLGEI